MFHVPTQTRYGLRALLELALHDGKGPLALQKISEKQHISQKYLENIFKLLKKADIIRSVRGPEGGYELARSPSLITAFDIARSLDGPVITVPCVHKGNYCVESSRCAVKDFWHEMNDTIEEYLKSKTLAWFLARVDGKKDHPGG
ncbi:MAG: Rrf2 family transcriptional regulator [Spirochaetales bacterium]|nr:Rrf2 family transcriptional regulator [Spirochaetales bacterium]